MTRWRIPLLIALGAAVALVGFVVGTASARQPGTPHPALLAGPYWAQLSPNEKQIYLSGFLAGAAAEQARATATAAGHADDSLATSSHAIERMRADRTLRYRFATPVYSAQLDDFYWWDNHVDTPIVDVMIRLNGDMLKQQTEGRP